MHSNACIFLNIATLTKHRILRYESYFFIFCVCMFFLKKHRTHDSKIQWAIFDPKITKEKSLGSHSETKNDAEFTSEKPRITKILQKSNFSTQQFLKHSFWARKGVGRAPGPQRTAPCLSPGTAPKLSIYWKMGLVLLYLYIYISILECLRV